MPSDLEHTGVLRVAWKLQRTKLERVAADEEAWES
jgi:hypothetical protein